MYSMLSSLLNCCIQPDDGFLKQLKYVLKQHEKNTTQSKFLSMAVIYTLLNKYSVHILNNQTVCDLSVSVDLLTK